MSKPILPDQPIVQREPAAQVKYFADLYHGAVDPVRLAEFKARVIHLGLHFTDDELLVFAALDTPDKIQEFLNTQIYYYDDHTVPNVEETAQSPRQVLQSGYAHCFEGALFAYAANYLHRHAPHLVLLEASQDSEHNLIVVRDQQTGMLGCNAHSAYPHLDGRAAQYRTVRALAQSYRPYYYSDYTRDPNDITLVGYSEPIDLVAKYGVAWLASAEPLWDIYYTYIDGAARFHYLDDESNVTHAYPLIRALQERWIEIDAQGKPFVNADHLPHAARELWNAFWQLHGDHQTYRRPQGAEAEIEKEFFRLTGTTPIDLEDNAFDLQFFLAEGYRVEQLFISHPERSAEGA